MESTNGGSSAKGQQHSHWLGDFYTICDLYRLCGRIQFPTHNSAWLLHKSLLEAGTRKRKRHTVFKVKNITSRFIHSRFKHESMTLLCVSPKTWKRHTVVKRDVRPGTSAALRRKRAVDNIIKQTPRVNSFSERADSQSEINVRIYGERQKSGDLRGKHSGASFHYRKNKKEDESGKFKWSLRKGKNTHFRDLHHFSPNEASLEMQPSN